MNEQGNKYGQVDVLNISNQKMMKEKVSHVDLTELSRLIKDLHLGDPKRNEYIEARFLNYVEWWDFRSRDSKKKYFRLRSAVIIGGALIPALVGLREVRGFDNFQWVFAVLSIIASLVVAICAGLESLFNYGGIWREKRAATEVIVSEGFCFLELTGNYKGFHSHQDAYKTFADYVEGLIQHEIKDYIVATNPPSSPAKGNNENLAPGAPKTP